MRAAGDPPVVVVTGGGGGIGAAIAEELGRQGAFVVTLDPLVTLDGSEPLPPPEETTAGRIVAAGGSARASAASVTDRAAVDSLFAELLEERGHLDAVVNVAGITRPTSYTGGTDGDWRRVLEVHLDGYLAVLRAALPIMAAAGHGRVLGVTSGSGWRAADAGAYGCAKRAVAALTWQLGPLVPPGVVVNALSPIAVTRMVTAALGRAPASATGGTATGGLSLGSMPQPEDIGPLGARLVGDDLEWCRGQVIFAGGSEVAAIAGPRVLEAVGTEAVSLAHVLEAVTAGALIRAEAGQVSTGGSNPRFGSVFTEAPTALPASEVRSCLVVAERPAGAAAIGASLADRGVLVHECQPAAGFAGAAGALAATVERAGPVDAEIVALAGGPSAPPGAGGWEQALVEHSGIVDQIHTDAGWARAVADNAAATDRPVRLVVLTDAVTAGGRSRAQAAAQLSRAAGKATGDRVAAFAVSVETQDAADERAVGEVAAHLAASPEAVGLAGAELAVSRGWFGLRSHPRPAGSISLSDPALPPWFDDALRSLLG
jgi:NAD(P)-dependent dehydrogenase (short-subunit alcohol dehydrogenase family)